MRPLLIAAALAAVGSAAPMALQPAPGPAASLVVRNATLIDGQGGPPRRGVSIVVRDGAIAAVVDEAVRAREEGRKKVILFNLCGHGLLDMAAYETFLHGKLTD